jgi:hypothetical protein
VVRRRRERKKKRRKEEEKEEGRKVRTPFKNIAFTENTRNNLKTHRKS